MCPGYGIVALYERKGQAISPLAWENGFEFIAASFTRTAQDILDIRKTLDELGGGKINIVAK
jgi:pyruvate kinase